MSFAARRQPRETLARLPQDRKSRASVAAVYYSMRLSAAPVPERDGGDE